MKNRNTYGTWTTYQHQMKRIMTQKMMMRKRTPTMSILQIHRTLMKKRKEISIM